MTSQLRAAVAACLLVLCSLILAAIGPARAQGDDDATAIDDIPHITIVGTAAAEVMPDLATITLGVAKSAPTAKAAADAVAATTQAVVAEARAQGIAPADIATRTLDLGQTFENTYDAQSRINGRRATGYEASNMLAIRVRDLAKAGVLAQALIDRGANTFDGIAFSIEHPQPTLDRLAAEAVSNARRQAELVAQAAGVKLGRVLLVERPGAGAGPGPGPVFAARAMAAPKAMPIEAGAQSLSAEMEVTWSIAP